MSRKLQAEIERVFKKVAEGIEGFEECYDKVLNASNTSQKEKYESDLKKEIKKLQRLRDQIKTWIQSNDIKDKQDLLHHRKLIEKQMEKFKAIEKEMKTKAYSKEGLMQSTKLDPKEKEKLDLCNWLVDSVDSLSTQIDLLEATAESIASSMGKKRRDPSKVERVSQLTERVERHKFHIRCLERIQRLLENDGLSTEQVQRIQEDVNYYVEENDNDEFLEDEYIYDELPLDDDDPLFAIPGEEDVVHNEKHSEDEDEPTPTKPAKHPTTLPPAPVEPKNAWADVKESVLSPSRPGTTTGTAHAQPALAQPWAAVASQNASAMPQRSHTPAVNGTRDSASHLPPTKSMTPANEKRADSSDLMTTFMKAKQQFSEKKANVYNAQNQMLELSLQGIPSLLDQERPKTRAGRTQVATPSYYPQTALPVIEHPGMASRLDLDTLFFAFYYQQDTYQQYLAAKELNRQSWRFHKKYLTWFQRYEEPSDITDDYEQGTYIYFDYESAWCQRKKSEFRFEYQYLEDGEATA
ncbi:Not1 N-terminal domain, CCR4-Not complex component-domain-containing protein [Coemansia mojavensis]|nr:Not1 N-terminal domain, CCR4-Not complex component-domain-containing protein [Coemansia mojavensis]